MWQFDGLPLHPLIVHAPVVLVPLVAAGLVLYVVWPASRRVLGPVLVVLAVSAAISSILAVETGEQLADRLQRGDTVDRHRSRGELVRLLAIVVAVGTGVVAWLDRSTHEKRQAFAVPAAGLGAVVATIGVVMVGLAGHTGAQLAWEGKIPAADAADAAAQVAEPTTAPELAPEATTPAEAEPTPTATAAAEPAVDVVLGEWAIVTSVTEAPPGPVTFKIRNAGEHTHSFRIRTTGSGSDRLEWRSPEIEPGDELVWTVDLPVGAYEFTCPIEDGFGEHDELGMEAPFIVREGAPPPQPLSPPTPEPAAPADPEPAATAAPDTASSVAVDIRAFAFGPAELRVAPGTEVTWTNADPAPHTATGDSFDTGILAQGEGATVQFDEPGTYPYICSLHPSMTATVIVEG